MDGLCCRVEEHIVEIGALPSSWSFEEFDDIGSLVELAHEIRRIGPRSDSLVRSLLSVGNDDLVAEVVISAAHPMLHCRCAGRPGLTVDDLTTELALAVASVRHDGVPDTGRHLLNVLVDMAWGQARKPLRRVVVPTVDAARVGHLLVSLDRHPEDVLDGVALEAFRDGLAAASSSQRGLVRCWNSAVDLGLRDERSQAERYRLKYARSQLRRIAPSELVG